MFPYQFLFLKFITIVFFLLRKFFDDGPSPANASGAPPPVHAGASESSGCSFSCYVEAYFHGTNIPLWIIFSPFYKPIKWNQVNCEPKDMESSEQCVESSSLA